MTAYLPSEVQTATGTLGSPNVARRADLAIFICKEGWRDSALLAAVDGRTH